MADVLAVVAAVGTQYPTVNHLGRDGFRGGKKSPAYHDLFAAVQLAAEVEVARVGWEIAEYPCAVDLTLYHRTGTFPDASNLGKAEWDALTAAGVWLNDKLARPVRLETEHDPASESRVVIIVRRRFPPYVSASSAVEIATRPSPRSRAPRVAPAAPVAVPVPVAAPQSNRTAFVYADGKPIPRDEFMRDLRAGKLKIR